MKITEKQIHQILEKAIWTPSGDNCQPWTFEWDQKHLKIFHDADRASHPLNPIGVTSILSLGCLLESIRLSSSEFSCKVSHSFQDFKNTGIAHWATVTFDEDNTERNPLADMLLTRNTDRRFFNGGDLRPELFEQTEMSTAQLHILNQPNQELINYIVEAEMLLLDHPGMLPETLKWARFSLADARKTRDGLSWRNLGAKFWEVPLMPIIRDFPKILKVAKYAIAPQHRSRIKKQLKSSAGVVCVSAPISDKKNIVTAGSLMMNAWLSLTRENYGVQPLTLSSTICTCAEQGLLELPEKWLKFFNEGENVLKKSFKISSERSPIWMLRTGRSTPLPDRAKTFRLPVSSVFSHK